jgi:PIN domain nuclease of toxin-antitoxin system
MGRVHIIGVYLLDTHILIWAMDDDPQLSRAHRTIIQGRAPLFVSVASIWEVAIKAALGKLMHPVHFVELIEAGGVSILPVQPEHAIAVASLPPIHRDPFDRMLVAQAQIEGLTILTADSHIKSYKTPTL